MRIDNIQVFFESKIDWKFFNFMIDKALMFEDEGFGVMLYVFTGDAAIYKYETNKGSRYVTATEPKTLIDSFKKNGIVYSIDVFNMMGDYVFEWEYNSDKTLELYNSIESRCKFIKFRIKNSQTILVQPL